MMKNSDAGEAPRQSNCKITKPCHIIQIRRIEITTKSGVHESCCHERRFLENLLGRLYIAGRQTGAVTTYTAPCFGRRSRFTLPSAGMVIAFFSGPFLPSE